MFRGLTQDPTPSLMFDSFSSIDPLCNEYDEVVGARICSQLSILIRGTNSVLTNRVSLSSVICWIPEESHIGL